MQPYRKNEAAVLNCIDPLVRALLICAVCHICRVAHETNDVLTLPPDASGPKVASPGQSFLVCTCHTGEIGCMTGTNRKPKKKQLQRFKCRTLYT